jgi:hypothetical protein
LIALLAASPLWTLGKNELPPKTAPELIAWLKTRSQPTTFATVGAGSAAHLVGLSFAKEIGARFEFVPYRGAAPAMQDLEIIRRKRIKPKNETRTRLFIRARALVPVPTMAPESNNAG